MAKILLTQGGNHVNFQQYCSKTTGGGAIELLRNTKPLIGTEFEPFYQFCHEGFFKGWRNTKSGKNIFFNEENFEEFVRSHCFDGKNFDFKIIKLTGSHWSCAISIELKDLIFPYIVPNGFKIFTGGEGPYETDEMKVEKGDVVIDAGANVGIFTAFAASYRGAAVHAFEPVSSVIKILKENIALNGISDKVVLNPLALSDESKELEISVDDVNVGASSFVLKRRDDCRKEKISTISLDEYVAKNSLAKIDFIKADIEGAERYLLKGAQNTLKTLKPKLSICTYHLPDDRKVLTDLILQANPSYKIEYSRCKLFAR